jgi:hypothetical protein
MLWVCWWCGGRGFEVFAVPFFWHEDRPGEDAIKSPGVNAGAVHRHCRNKVISFLFGLGWGGV